MLEAGLLDLGFTNRSNFGREKYCLADFLGTQWATLAAFMFKLDGPKTGQPLGRGTEFCSKQKPWELTAATVVGGCLYLHI